MKSQRGGDQSFVSLSDLMTGLMMIFLFVAVAFMLQVRAEQAQKDEIIEDFSTLKLELYEELRAEFEQDFRPERWNAILGKDLSIRFVNDQVHFDFDKAELKSEFAAILDSFFPRYLGILLKQKYRRGVAEVRIEGHTDSVGAYMYNIHLSQARAAKVLHHLLFAPHSAVPNLLPEDQAQVRFWLSSTGYASARTLDRNGDYTLEAKGREDEPKSRRVEFRVVTTADDVFEILSEKVRR